MIKPTKDTIAINKTSRLTELAEKDFDDVSKAEKKLFKAVVKGEFADYSAEAEEDNDPAKGETWGNERALNAKIITWLCTEPQACVLVTHRGILIKGARIDGELGLQCTKISFPLDFKKSAIPKGIDLRNAKIATLSLLGTYTGSILADNLRVRGGIFLGDGFKIEGSLRLMCASISGGLICTKGELINPEGDALCADNLNTGGDVFLRSGFKAEGRVRLMGASIRGDLICAKGEFINPEGEAISAGRLKVEGNVFLDDGFKAEGEVNLIGASIRGGIVGTKGEFINPEGDALSANNLNADGTVFLNDGFKAEGEVSIVGGSIGGSIVCTKGEFINPKGEALSANNLNVGGDVFLNDGFKAEGKVNLTGTSIVGLFVWADISSPTEVELDLRSARIGTLRDDDKSWPQHGKLFLSGFTYDRIHREAPIEAKMRIDWLRRQPEKPFTPQPYEQLAALYRKIGHDGDAKKILIEKSKDRAKFVKLMSPEWFWYHIFGWLIGYGYKPSRAFCLSLLVILLGWGIFSMGFSAKLITPTNEWAYISNTENIGHRMSEDYPKFQSLVYSLDVFVPVIDFRLANYWMPNAYRQGKLLISNGIKIPLNGSALRWYKWLHIIAGWVLTTLWVVGLTGAIKS
jgi:predicted acyltransferase (DUF342 family)